MKMYWLNETRTQRDDQKPTRHTHWIVKDSFTFRANSAWVEQRADDRKFFEDFNLERSLAFAMGCHKRLGERSQIKNLNADVVRCIEKIVMNCL